MASWLGLQPEFQCPGFTCDFLQGEVAWWCDRWVCDVPEGPGGRRRWRKLKLVQVRDGLRNVEVGDLWP